MRIILIQTLQGRYLAGRNEDISKRYLPVTIETTVLKKLGFYREFYAGRARLGKKNKTKQCEGKKFTTRQTTVQGDGEGAVRMGRTAP